MQQMGKQLEETAKWKGVATEYEKKLKTKANVASKEKEIQQLRQQLNLLKYDKNELANFQGDMQSLLKQHFDMKEEME